MVDIINNPAVALYVASGVALVVMVGFFIYLWSLDRRVRELQHEIERDTASAAREAASQRPRGAEPLRPQPIEKGAK